MSFIVTRAPFRVSFAGGGTDIPSFYEREEGAVISTAIDKYVYVMVNRCRPLVSEDDDHPLRHRIRLSYSSTENVQRPHQLKHPIVRDALKLLELDAPMDIATMADVPSGTGLGSSGTFAVALLHGLHLFKGEEAPPDQLAAEAAQIEINMVGRPVGKQDHYAAAFGGLNLIRFHGNQEVTVRPLGSALQVQSQIFPYLMLLYTGVSRDAGAVLEEQQANMSNTYDELLYMRDQAFELDRLFQGAFHPRQLGEVLHEAWMRKRKLASGISNGKIDHWYNEAIKAGALGGKLCGAGGGGFLLLVVEQGRRGAVKEALKALPELSFSFEPLGSQALLSPTTSTFFATGGPNICCST